MDWPQVIASCYIFLLGKVRIYKDLNFIYILQGYSDDIIYFIVRVSHFLKTSIGRSILRFENNFIILECVFNLKNKMMVEFLMLNCTKIKDIMSSLIALNDYLSILLQDEKHKG